MDLLRVGKIVNTQGIKGELRVIAITDFPADRFAAGKTLYVGTSAAEAQPVTVVNARPHKQFILVQLANYDTIDAVLGFKGQTLYAAATDEPPLADGEYYYHQIIGLQVIDEESGEDLGQVQEILSPGANDVWVVTKPNTPDLLLPYIPPVVHKIDLPAGKVYVTLMEGMR